MPHVKKRVKTRDRQDGTTVSTTVYQAVWREHANGADRTKEFRRKGDAERFLVDIQHRLMTGAYTDPVLGRTPFREVAERYLPLGVWKPKTRQTATEKLRYAIDKFGDRPIASIHKGDVQALIPELGDVLAPSTIRIVRQHVGATFTRAIDDKLIVANPAVGVRLPRVETPSVVPLNAKQVHLLLDAADPWYRVAIVIGAGIGLRSSEAAGLTVDRIDFLRRTTRVDRQWQQATQKAAGGFTSTKTRASNRVIPTSQWVLDEIAAHLVRRPAGRRARCHRHSRRPAPRRRSVGLLLPSGTQARRLERLDHVPRPPPLLRLGADCFGLLDQAGADGPRPRFGKDHPRHLRPPHARRRRQGERRDRSRRRFGDGWP